MPDRRGRALPDMIEAVIGLEIHAQLRTRTKLFCRCPVGVRAGPNTSTCPVCLGLPGALPVLNARAVDMAATAALALGCEVSRSSGFARKNYFYPDLPKGYQITQYEEPLAKDGQLPVPVDGGERVVRIVRLHLEEDAGKSLHDASSDIDASLIDFNRSGVPLIEIVTAPDLRSGAEAAQFLRHLRAILIAIGVNDGNMEDGNLRCDGNVSVRQSGQNRLGTKVEIKNLNSFRFLQKAIDYEFARQSELAGRGEAIAGETRQWDAGAGSTVAMRGKEGEHDYRYFPEPDLPPLEVSRERLAALSASLPELPAARRERLIAEFGLAAETAAMLSESASLSDYFEATARESRSPRAAAEWIRGEVLRRLSESGLEIAGVPVGPQALGRLIAMVEDGRVSGQAAKKVFGLMFASGESPEAVIEREGLGQLSDERALRAIVADVLQANAQAAAQYRAGKTATLGFLVGAVMKASGGRANPRMAERAIREQLDSGSGT